MQEKSGNFVKNNTHLSLIDGMHKLLNWMKLVATKNVPIVFLIGVGFYQYRSGKILHSTSSILILGVSW